jgi:hypothetical protein
MAFRESIINAALHHIGETESADALNSEDTWVKRIRDRVDERARSAFETHYWNFAITVQQLTPTDPTPEGWDYGFNKPVKCWCIKKVASSNDPRARDIPYDDRAGRICTDQETTFLHFVDGYWLDYHGSWPQVFADLIAIDVAEKVLPVTNMSELAKSELRKEAKSVRRTAKNWNAMQTHYVDAMPSAWQSGRFSSTRIGGRGGENG